MMLFTWFVNWFKRWCEHRKQHAEMKKSFGLGYISAMRVYKQSVSNGSKDPLPYHVEGSDPFTRGWNCARADLRGSPWR